MKRSTAFGLAALLLAPPALLVACSSDDDMIPGETEGDCGKNGPNASDRFAPGSPDGHADPFGAKAAKAARAGRVRDESMAVQGLNPKGRVLPGDFVMANDKVAVYIAGRLRTDGSLQFGGKITAASPVGDDGRPLPTSDYGETLLGFSRQSVDPDNISVLADGSDGGPAIVRVSGKLSNVPFLEGVFSVLSREPNLPAAIDYILNPGESKLRIRLQLANIHDYAEGFSDQHFIGLLHVSRAQRFLPGSAFDEGKNPVPWAALDTGGIAYAFKPLGGSLRPYLKMGGVDMLLGPAPKLEACSKGTFEEAELHIASSFDRVVESVSDPATQTFKSVTATVKQGSTPVAGAYVHVTGDNDLYLTRALTGAGGSVSIRVPSNATKLTATMPGRTPVSVALTSSSDAALNFSEPAKVSVHITEKGGTARIPARIQWLRPTSKLPTSWGVNEELGDRVIQTYSVGDADPVVALEPGEYDVVVTRGTAWSAHTERLTVAAGATRALNVALTHTVESPTEMCADFHIHTKLSFDATDPVDDKIRAAVADGLEIPAQSDHEWVSSFQDRIVALGLGKYAYSIPSEEITSGAFGHFGIVPLYPDAKAVNNGAAPWQNRPIPEMFDWVHARPEQPALIINHPMSTIGMGYFAAASFSMAEAKGLDATNWSDKFEAIEVFNDSDFDANRGGSVAAWFAMLSAGKTYWAVGNSDSHYIREYPVGYPRTCFSFGHHDPSKLTPELVRDALKSGNSVVDGGLRLTVRGPNGELPGGTMKSAEGKFRVSIDSSDFVLGGELETYVDGTLLRTDPIAATEMANGAHHDEIDVQVTSSSSRARHWVVFHARGKAGTDLSPLHMKRKAFGVSNPIFFGQ